LAIVCNVSPDDFYNFLHSLKVHFVSGP
jgi:hypothetical protein